jgi:predicted amidophosphoribosyltransferase
VAQLIRGGLVQVERAMLSDGPGPVEALRESGFIADGPDDYCPRCGRGVGPGEFVEGRCGTCRRLRLAWDGLVRLGPYGMALREAVHEFKFNRWHTVGEHLGHALGAAVAERLRLVALHADEPERQVLGRTIVAPVPMSFWRRASRGIDHSGCLARAVSSGSGLPYRRLLARQHRPAQTGLSAAARQRNLRGAMRPLGGPEAFAGVRIVVLVDDVMTTGATMVEACRSIRNVCGKGEVPLLLAACVAVSDGGRRKPEAGRGVGDGVVVSGGPLGGPGGGRSKKSAGSGAFGLDAQ